MGPCLSPLPLPHLVFLHEELDTGQVLAMLPGAGHGQTLGHPQLNEKGGVSRGPQGKVEAGSWRAGQLGGGVLGILVCVQETTISGSGEKGLPGHPQVSLEGWFSMPKGRRTRLVFPQRKAGGSLPWGRRSRIPDPSDSRSRPPHPGGTGAARGRPAGAGSAPSWAGTGP